MDRSSKFLNRLKTKPVTVDSIEELPSNVGEDELVTEAPANANGVVSQSIAEVDKEVQVSPVAVEVLAEPSTKPANLNYLDELDQEMLNDLNALAYGKKSSPVQKRSNHVQKLAGSIPASAYLSSEEQQEIEDGLEDAEELLEGDEDDDNSEDQFHGEPILVSEPVSVSEPSSTQEPVQAANEDQFHEESILTDNVDKPETEHNQAANEDRFHGELPSESAKDPKMEALIEQHKKDAAIIAAGMPNEPNYEWIKSFASRNNLTEKQVLEIWKRDTQKNQDAIDQARYAEKCKNFKSKYQFEDESERTGLYLPMCPEFKEQYHIPDNVDVFSLEKCYDYVYATLKKEKEKTTFILNASRRHDKALKKVGEDSFLRAQKRKAIDDKKAQEHLILSGVEVGDKKAIQEARQELMEGYAMGLTASIDLEAEELDASKMPETEFYYWESGMNQLDKVYGRTLEVVYSGSGRFGGIEFGWKTRFPFINGLDNSSIYLYQSISHCDKSIIDTLYSLPGNARTFWMQLFNGSPNQSRISKFAPYVSNLKKHKTHSITGKHIAWKVIPPREAFDKKVQQLDPYDLLPLLPKAEADTFLIHLGRVAYGTNKTHVVDNMKYRTNEVVESDITIPYRSGVVLHGDRNIGKSQLLELIVQALTLAGYSTRALGVTFNQFGRKPLTTADLAYIDDAVDRKVVQALSDGHLKTTASGGVMDVEDKGKDGEERIARAALLFAINRLCFPQNFDIGVAHRFHFLQIHSEQQMNEISAKAGQNMIPAALWERLSKELDVDVRLFGLYLLRCGLERYLEAAGLELQENGKYKQVRFTKDGKPGIETQLEANRAKYVFQPPVEEKEYICSMSRRCFAITKYLEPTYLDTMHPEYDNSFHAFTLLHTGNIVTRLQNEIDECETIKANIIQFEGNPKLIEWQDEKQAKLKKLLHWIDPKGMIPTAIWIQLRRYWQLKALSGQSLGDSKKFTLEAIWDEFVSLITTFDGRPIEPTRYEWTPAFLSAKNNTQGFLTEIQAMMDDFMNQLSEPEVAKLRRVATPFGYPITKMSKDEIHFKDI